VTRRTKLRPDNRPPLDLDPEEEAGVLRGLAEFAAGKGKPVAQLRAKLRRIIADVHR
jgi:hypothetical protein